MRAHHSGCYSVIQANLANFCNFTFLRHVNNQDCKTALALFSEFATKKCKSVAVLQLSSILMIGQT